MDRARITQKSLLEFLSGTGLPLSSGVPTLLRWGNLGLAILCLAHGAWLWGTGASAFAPGLIWAGWAAPIAAVPLFALGYSAARRRRLDLSTYGLLTGIYALSIMASVIRGPFASAWYVQPVLAVAATFTLGVAPGLLLTIVSALALGWTGWSAEAVSAEFDPVRHCGSLMVVTLAAGLLGAFLHKILLAALWSERLQRDRIRDTRKALRHREKLLRHALRVETVGDLAGMVVHQLRNQLQLVLGHVFVGQRQSGEEQRERMAMIAEVLHESRPLLDQLMGLAHPDDGKPTSIELGGVVADFATKVERILPSRLELKLSLCETPLPVLLDRRGLEHALWNLIINAGQAMPDDGGLEIATGSDEGCVWVSVADTGPGIDPEKLELIFEPYFTTKPPGEGTGLGLTAVSRFVRGSQGEVDVNSEVGRGTRFTLRFPEFRAPSESRAG